MTTINVKDAAGATVAVARVADTGQAAEASSLPVVLPAAQITALTPPAAIAGFATAANQATEIASLASIDGKAPALGQALAAASVPVVLTAAQITTLTPPAAIAGFATAANQATLAALLPASLGIKTAAGSLSVAPASDAVFSVASQPSTLTDRSGTITAGGTAQQVEASAATRRGFMIQNASIGNLWVSTLATAVQSQPSILIPPNAMYETPMGGGGTGAISIIGATTGQAFTARTWV